MDIALVSWERRDVIGQRGGRRKKEKKKRRRGGKRKKNRESMDDTECVAVN